MLGRILSLFTALMLACAPASAYAPERSIAAPELRAWAPKTASREFAAAAKQAAKQNPAASVCRVWEIWSPPLKLASSMGFTGYYADAESGDYYAQQRYYRQGIGRFLSVDPWSGDQNNPITLNKYLYANGNPLRFIDPDGRRGCDSMQCTLLQARNLARTDDERARIDQLRATEVQVQAGKADALEAFIVENVEATVELAVDVGAATIEQSTGGLVNLGGKDRLAARGEALYDFATNDPLGQIERGLEGRAAEAQRLREAGDIRGATRVSFGTGLEVVSVAGGGVGAARGTLLAANRLVRRSPPQGDASIVTEGNGLTPAVADTLGNRGLTFVGENLGKPRNAAMQAARDFEFGTTGAFSDIATMQRQVPALRFDNPNPQGAPYVKFDGFQQLDNGTVELIDSKTRIVPFATKDGPFISASVRDGLVRKSQALTQNPGYSGVIELPSAAARKEAQQVLRQLGITNLSTRVREP